MFPLTEYSSQPLLTYLIEKFRNFSGLDNSLIEEKSIKLLLSEAYTKRFSGEVGIRLYLFFKDKNQFDELQYQNFLISNDNVNSITIAQPA
ncbi:MAG: hypothetical protein BWY67_01151 [Bacteroidetes bacterium ADurb.Bin397]|nr:MAG: hypothetical protein BWY67_01151 [Bacteroidetes bacterium ADurb.Bin397]